jgi:bifunctional non-homologous end joining protein LigD
MFQPCLPTPRKRAPSGAAWVHEIKHDGYRLIVRRDGDRVRLYTRRAYNWSGRYPRIIEAVRRLKVRSVILDGEAVVIGDDGRSDFDRLHTAGYYHHAVLFAFDLLELDGEDWRPRPLEQRKAKLAKVLGRSQDGIHFNEHLDDDGELVFKHDAAWGSRASCRSAGTSRTTRAGQRAGSR